MTLLKPIYALMKLEQFGSCMFAVWESLAGILQNEIPFFTICCIDDQLFWKNKNKVKSAFEEMLSFYD